MIDPEVLEFFYLEARAGVAYTRQDWRRLTDDERVARLVAMDRLRQEDTARLAGALIDPVMAVAPLDGGRLARRRVLEGMVERGAAPHQ